MSASELKDGKGSAIKQGDGLSWVRRRRAELWMVASIVLVGMAAALVLTSLSGLPEPLPSLSTLPVVRIAFLAFTVFFALYVREMDGKLRKVERQLLEARVRQAMLADRVRELSLILEAARAVNSSLEPEKVMAEILDAALEITGAEGARVLLGEGEEGVAVERSWKGEGLDRVSLPLSVRGRNVGRLEVEGRNLAEEKELLGVFAEYAAVAAENASLHARQKKTLEQLAEVDRKKDEFIAALAARLRAPLAEVLGFIAPPGEGADVLDPEKAREYLGRVRSQVRFMERVVEELLQASQLVEGGASGRRRLVDLAALVREACQRKADRSGRPIRVAIPRRPLTVWADPEAISQILENLLDNCVKHTPEGTLVRVMLWEAGAEVKIVVEDSGPGIPPEDLPFVFEGFRRPGTGAHQLGLGLYVARGLARAHGGRIEVWSEPGKGARFTVSIPREPV